LSTGREARDPARGPLILSRSSRSSWLGLLVRGKGLAWLSNRLNDLDTWEDSGIVLRLGNKRNSERDDLSDLRGFRQNDRDWVVRSLDCSCGVNRLRDGLRDCNGDGGRISAAALVADLGGDSEARWVIRLARDRHYILRAIGDRVGGMDGCIPSGADINIISGDGRCDGGLGRFAGGGTGWVDEIAGGRRADGAV